MASFESVTSEAAWTAEDFPIADATRSHPGPVAGFTSDYDEESQVESATPAATASSAAEPSSPRIQPRSGLNPAAPEFVPMSHVVGQLQGQLWVAETSSSEAGATGSAHKSGNKVTSSFSATLQSVRLQELWAARCLQRAWRSWRGRQHGKSELTTQTRSFLQAAQAAQKADKAALAQSMRRAPSRTSWRHMNEIARVSDAGNLLSNSDQIRATSSTYRSHSRKATGKRRGRGGDTVAPSSDMIHNDGLTTRVRIALLGKQHHGTISRFEPSRGVGWIESPEVRHLTNDCVLVDCKLLESAQLSLGDEVAFRIELNSDSRPRARDVRSLLCEQKAMQSITVEELLKTELDGIITEVHPSKGYGFLLHPDVNRLTGYDVYFRLAQFPGKGLGDQLNFRLELDRSGRPRTQHHEISAATPAKRKGRGSSAVSDPWAAAASKRASRTPANSRTRPRPMTHEELVTEIHFGEVAELCESKGHGFIRSERIFQLVGKDVFFRMAEFPQAQHRGDAISFRVVYDRDGKPRASSAAWYTEEESPWGSYVGVTRSSNGSSMPRDVDELVKEHHTGIIKEFHADQGSGFVESESVHRICGHNVLFLRGQFPNCRVGDHVSFQVELDDVGRPRVRDTRHHDLRLDGMDSESPMSLEECLDTVHLGVIADYDPLRSRGFVRNRRIHRLFGKDVLFHKGQFPGTRVGDTIQFGVELDLDGRPRARAPSEVEAEKLHKTERGAADSAADPSADTSGIELLTLESLTSQRHDGVIYQFSSEKGYGFVRNLAIHRLCGRDVFISASQFAGQEVGNTVSFSVELTDDGLPRARELLRAGADVEAAVPNEGPLTVELMLTQEHAGTIAEFDEVRGFGFIKNRWVHKLCGKDVYFRKGEFSGKSVGDSVVFRVALDASGRPRTKDKEDHDADSSHDVDVAADPEAEGIDALLTGEHDGVIKEYFFDKAYGFITSRRIHRALGKDLFFRGVAFELQDVKIGDPVRFVAEVDQDGRPKARIISKRGVPVKFVPTGSNVPSVPSRQRAKSAPPASAQSPATANPGLQAMKMLAPDLLAAAVIGRKGAGIEEIQRSTGASLTFSQRGGYYPGTDCRVLTVSAESEGALRDALQRVIDIAVEHNKEQKKEIGSSTRVDHTDSQLQVLIPTMSIDHITGDDGAGLCRLQDASGVTTVLSRTTIGAGPMEEQSLELRGHAASLRAAIAWLCRRLQRSSSEPWFHQWASGTNMPADPHCGGTGASSSRAAAEATGNPQRAGAEHACEFTVMLGSDFGPMGLRFRAGYQPAVEAMRPEVSNFWEHQGLKLGDRLCRVNGRLVEGREPEEVLQELGNRPVLLSFSRTPWAKADVEVATLVIDAGAIPGGSRREADEFGSSAPDAYGGWSREGTSWWNTPENSSWAHNGWGWSAWSGRSAGRWGESSWRAAGSDAWGERWNCEEDTEGS